MMIARKSHRKVLLALALAYPTHMFPSCTPQACSVSERTRPTQSVKKGERAPLFAGTNFDGRPLTLSGYRGQVVLLNFWASWCSSCLIEMPTLLKWQNELGPRGLRIVGVSMDDEKQAAQKIVTKFGLNYPVTMATPAVAERYGVLGLPESFLINRNGVVTSVYIGELSMQQVHQTLEQLLDNPEQTGKHR